MLIDELIKYIDKRDELVEDYFNGDLTNCFKSQDTKDLYEKFVRPIDWKIIRIANRIMRREFNANTTTFIRVSDVLKSQEIGELYHDRKAELCEMMNDDIQTDL